MPTKTPGSSPALRMQEELAKFRQEISAVMELGLKSKSAAVRALMPRLDQLNELGFAQEKLVEVMAEEGLEMTLGYLKTTLWRERENAKQGKRKSS